MGLLCHMKCTPKDRQKTFGVHFNDGTELLMKSLTTDQDYYFAVEAFNENGVSLPSEPQYVE